MPDPIAPKIKLKLAEPPAPAPSHKLTFKIASKASPAVTPAVTPAPPTNGASKSNAAANGTSRRNPFSVAQPSSAPIPLEQLERAKSVSGSVASPSPSLAPAPVKNEEVARNSPALVAPNGVRSASQASATPVAAGSVVMAPPSTPALSAVNTYSSAGYAQSFAPQQPQYQQPSPIYESKWRQPGQSKSKCYLLEYRFNSSRSNDHQSWS